MIQKCAQIIFKKKLAKKSKNEKLNKIKNGKLKK